jgi:aminoglycoside phosphotransferase family enzyme
VEGHGAPVPEHFCLQGDDVHALAPLDAQPKFRQLDAANDVAVLINALESRGQGEHAELLVKRYVAAAKDRDLPRVLPLYCVLQALRDGLQRSEWVAELSPDSAERPELARQATAAYNQALRVARALPKLI